jgi:hypothetical protein
VLLFDVLTPPPFCLVLLNRSWDALSAATPSFTPQPAQQPMPSHPPTVRPLVSPSKMPLTTPPAAPTPIEPRIEEESVGEPVSPDEKPALALLIVNSEEENTWQPEKHSTE